MWDLKLKHALGTMKVFGLKRDCLHFAYIAMEEHGQLTYTLTKVRA